jgi:hypothetical protein
MPTNELYFLIMVCGAFGVFALVLAGSYVKYRQWLKQTPHAADD